MSRRFTTLLTTNEHGKPHMVNRVLFERFLKENPNAQFTVEIKKNYVPITDDARRYYWGVVVSECKRGLRELGWDYDPNQTHEFIKSCSDVMRMDNGEYRSISELSMDEFSEYIDDVKRFAAIELHMDIPDADPQKKQINK